MDIAHRPRHTRRGFLRGDCAPKFFATQFDLPAQDDPAIDFRPPSSQPVPVSTTDTAAWPAPPGAVENKYLEAAINFEPPTDEDMMLEAIHASLAQPKGNAFLSWLAEQIEGKQPEDYDPFVDQGLFWDDGSADDDSFFEESFDAAYIDDPAEIEFVRPEGKSKRVVPKIEISPDGWRVEVFHTGSRVVKDVLGRVVEVHSRFGDCLFFRYGELGYIESFERVSARGQSHSFGSRDKHGVVVRNAEGRVRAAGESMTVDPRGCFYLHTFDGQFFSIDLVTGIHLERRKIFNDDGTFRYVTSLFTHDGFRMATMFGALKDGIAVGGTAVSRFRFYGRDGTAIEFESEDDLHQLRPAHVKPPATSKVSKSWLQRRQATTAWDAVRDYLIRVS